MAEQPVAPRPPFPPEEPKGNLASNILAIVGFIILIVVVIWGLVNLASLSRGWFSSFFGGRGAAIEVTVPESATSGTPFTLSWEYDEPVEGTYALLYPCTSGLSFQTPRAAGAVGIPCGAAFTLPATGMEMALTPYLSGEERDVALSVIYLPGATSTSSGEATQRAEGSATVRIAPLASATPTPTPSAEPTPAPTPTPTPATTPSAPKSAPASPADLSVRIISVSIDAGGNGTAIFDIANVGGSTSGSYSFTASLPTASAYTYASPMQNPLAPQARITSTLRFSQARTGVFSVAITTSDANGADNYASQTVNAPYYYDGYNYQYNYLPPQIGAAAYPYQYGYQHQTYAYPNLYTYPAHQYAPYYQQSYYSTYYPYVY